VGDGPDITLYDYPSSICSQMARLVLVEKGVVFTRRTVDIMETNEQFEPWYVALNPKAVVPTLQIGDEVVTDTIRIVNRVQEMKGPDLSGGPDTQIWLTDIMAPHYGVLMYAPRRREDGTVPQVEARGRLLQDLAESRPDLADMLAARIDGNRRFKQLLRDPKGIQGHVENVRGLVGRMADALAEQPFISGPAYSLADCFATACLARLTIHGFSDWWAQGPVADYYAAMKERPSFAAAQVIDDATENEL
jgi:glutathione S-transferase